MEPPSKRCVTCHQERPLSDYNRRAAATDGLQARCRSCAREWYLENQVAHRANVRLRNQRVRRENKASLERFLLDHACVDCGEADLRVLDLDHDDPAVKLSEVGRLMAASIAWGRIESEIAKCSVRCANCHRRRTAAQHGWWREAAEERRRSALREAASARLISLTASGGTLEGPPRT